VFVPFLCDSELESRMEVDEGRSDNDKDLSLAHRHPPFGVSHRARSYVEDDDH
jgi:hypothetical protein